MGAHCAQTGGTAFLINPSGEEAFEDVHQHDIITCTGVNLDSDGHFIALSGMG